MFYNSTLGGSLVGDKTNTSITISNTPGYMLLNEEFLNTSTLIGFECNASASGVLQINVSIEEKYRVNCMNE